MTGRRGEFVPQIKTWISSQRLGAQQKIEMRSDSGRGRRAAERVRRRDKDLLDVVTEEDEVDAAEAQLSDDEEQVHRPPERKRDE